MMPSFFAPSRSIACCDRKLKRSVRSATTWQPAVSNPDNLAALASGSHVWLINKLNADQAISVNGQRAVLTPYAVTVVEA